MLLIQDSFFFSNIGILCRLSTIVAVCHMLVCCGFIFSHSKNFSDFTCGFWLDPLVIWNALCNFHIWVNFFNFFLLLISNFIPFLYDFKFCKFIKSCFMTSYIVYLTCSIFYLRGMCVLMLGGTFCRCLLGLLGLQHG